MRNALITLVVLGALCYANAVGNPFVHDDVVFILQNPKVHDLTNILDVFAKTSFAPPTMALANPYYRPFLDIVYRLEYFFFGISPAGYHMVNIFLHITNACLLFILAFRLTQRRGFSWCVAALFLLHPIQTEAVACISGISNLLFAFFLLASFWLYMKTADRSVEISLADEATYYSAALYFFGSALLCKEQAIVLPFLLLIYEFCFPHLVGKGTTGWRLRLSGFAIVAGGYLLWRKTIIGASSTSFVTNWGEFYLRLKAFPAIIMNHIQTVFLPIDLHYYRSYDILAPWVWPCVSFTLFIFVCVLLWRVLPHNRRPFFSFGLLWFALTILPTTSIIPLVHEYSFIAAFEHFLYLPLFGLLLSIFTVLDFWAEQVFHKQSINVKKVFIAGIIMLSIALTYTQTKMWAGEIPLFEKAVKFENRMGRLHLLLARAFYNDRDYKQSKREYAMARDIMMGYLGKIKDERVRPFYEGFLRDSLLGLAACEQTLGNWTAAQVELEHILLFFPHDIGVENNLGFIAVRLEKWDRAVYHFQQALKQEPLNVQVLTNLGVCYIHDGQLDKAQESFRRVLEINPNFDLARKNLEQLLKQQSQEHTIKDIK